MSASTTNDTPSQDRSKRGHRGRGRGGNTNKAARRSGDNKPASDVTSTNEPSKSPTTTTNDIASAASSDDAPVCWICAEPVKYYSLSACNHRTCHVCALRLRALYKKLDCTFCKEPQLTVIFTASADADFASYTPDAIPYKDPKLAIFFETQDMMEETLILLRFNCPDAECDYTAPGWGDLKLHTRAVHGKLLCDLCIRCKKVFVHEHALYPPNLLPLHLPSIPHRSNKQPLKDPIEGGTHPLCEFCRECFFGDDELFVHMRDRHEECFLCKRNDVRNQYFHNYESLELHFSRAHFACTNVDCQAHKFIVFNSELDLKAHQVEVHGADMSSKDRRDARRIQAEFEFDDAGGTSRRGRRDRGDREREREPPPQIMQTPGRTGGRRREAFGGHLTTEGTQMAQPLVPSRRASPIRDDVDPLVSERDAAFITRLQHIAPNPNSAVAAVKAAMRGYRVNELSARDLISTVWNVLDHDLDDTASIINGVVDLLEEEEKKRDLLAAWNGFKIEVRINPSSLSHHPSTDAVLHQQRQQFPDLVPTAVGSGYAGIASGRVLNAKHATASRSSQQSSRQLWDRVAQAANASSSTSRSVPGASTPTASSSTVLVDRFPPLAGPSFRQPARHTPWTSASSARGSSASTAVGVGVATSTTSISPKKKGKVIARETQAPPTLSATAFPQLPTAQPRTNKPPMSGNMSLRPVTSAWKANASANANGSVGTGSGAGSVGVVESMQTQTSTQMVQEQSEMGVKGKKGKGKGKQTLFTLGSFPT
ncbi:hypothetical protein JVT61DRAFT_12459 [Boletus reticuloceps]|uniref:RING-type E3 ubiquitin transferase n=1 Tax=Boletus reticuloceps TaxID=495285 RepID=A0A8I2YDN0_9AGAM|nr:hypothetical protein JVT61DRAFT_12459 [Boletus reticuloceps]